MKIFINWKVSNSELLIPFRISYVGQKYFWERISITIVNSYVNVLSDIFGLHNLDLVWTIFLMIEKNRIKI